jgi:NAD(P)-dependent dehydrogenase (short-subunit alcohol dehydrogenase family)
MGDSVIRAENILNRFKLNGRTAFITGAAQGIGRAYAHALAEAGAKVAVADVNTRLAQVVVDEISGKGGTAIAIYADVTDEESIQNACKEVNDAWGSLTIGINNAGIGVWSDAETQTAETWNKVISINLSGVYLCCKTESKYMISQGYGKIINIASMSGHIVNTPQNQSAYNTTKAGVLHLTKSLAAEWAPKGVRVNSISPGYTRTQLVDDLLKTPIGEKMMPVWMERTPMGKMLDVTDLQGAAVFLSGSVSDFMTGADILVDGGYCSW